MLRASSLEVGKEMCPGYYLRRLRGRGAFGSVWEAEREDGTVVALKFLRGGDPIATAQEIRSIQTVQKLRHPNLTRIHGVWCHRGHIVISMELAEGSLLDLLEISLDEFGAPLAPEVIFPYLTQAARALDFLNRRQHRIDGHEVAILHCDVKPSNILLFGDTVKLCDFGLSSITMSAMKHHHRAGTPDFCGPEVFLGRLSDRTDQYALAVSYCVLRTGDLPFSGEAANFEDQYFRPRPDLSKLSAAERPIVARALSREPQDRWPTCGDLIDQLKGLAR